MKILAVEEITTGEKAQIIAVMEERLRQLGFEGSYAEGTPAFEHFINNDLNALIVMLETSDYEEIEDRLRSGRSKPDLLLPECTSFFRGRFKYGSREITDDAVLTYEGRGGFEQRATVRDIHGAISHALQEAGFEKLCELRHIQPGKRYL